MKEYIGILKDTELFSGLAEEDILSMLSCLGARLRYYKKGEYLLRQGEIIGDILLLAEGKVLIQREDYWGNRSILSSLSPGDMFGEAYAAPGSGPLLNDATALTDCTVIFLDINRVIGICSAACPFHALVLRNFVFAMSGKNRALVQKLGHMSRRSTREKLMSYLSLEAGKQASAEFSIPFSRQQLADFLSVDRSAMSAELGRMRDEGLIEFHRSCFKLLHGKYEE